MNARSGLAFYVPLFWVIFSETAVDARLAEIQQVSTPNRLLSVPAPPEEEAAYSRGGQSNGTMAEEKKYIKKKVRISTATPPHGAPFPGISRKRALTAPSRNDTAP